MPEVILPCPACGSIDCECLFAEDEMYSVDCVDCSMRGPAERNPDSAISAWNTLPRSLTWTNEPPKVAGKLYLAKGMNLVVFLVATIVDNGTLYAQLPDSTDKCPLSDFVEWAGPIPAPID